MLTIIWDVDDVLNNLMYEWFTHQWLPGHPQCNIKYEQIIENPPHNLLGADIGEYLASLDAFRMSEQARQMQPVPEVLAWFVKHGHKCRHVALTATPLIGAGHSAGWVIRHFGQWIRSFNFVPSNREGQCIPVYDRTKADYLKWLGQGDVLIDDSLVNIESAKELGIKCILMPRPWNGACHSISNVLDSLSELI